VHLDFFTAFGDWALANEFVFSSATQRSILFNKSKYPPAEPRALNCEPLKAAKRGRFFEAAIGLLGLLTFHHPVEVLLQVPLLVDIPLDSGLQERFHRPD